MAKRLISCAIVLVITLSMLTTMFACERFLGGIKAFAESGDFYDKVGNVVFSIFAGNGSYIPLLSSEGICFDMGIDIKDYKVDGSTVKDGAAAMSLSYNRTANYCFDYELSANAFDLDIYKREIVNDNEMYIEYGDSINKPLYFSGECDSYLSSFVGLIKDAFIDANFIDGKANYSLNGVNFKTNTVEVCLNSTVLNDLCEKYSMFLIESINLVYNEMHYDFNDIWYFVDGEKLHLTWKRFFDGREMCREYIKLHDNNNHHITFDCAYAEDDDTEYVEISLKANDGTSTFDLLSASVTKENKGNEFETTAEIMVGDEILVITSNCGDDNRANGNADIRLMDSIGEMRFPITFSYEGDREGGHSKNGIDLKQKISISADNIYFGFNAVINVLASKANDIKINKPQDYYDLGSLEEIYYYHSIGELDYTNRTNALLAYFKGDTPDYIKPGTAVEPFKVDIIFDDGNAYETDGAVGKVYVDMLMSDRYVYKYSFRTDELGYPVNTACEYRDGKDRLYEYNYSDGTEYEELHIGTTRYEVRHDIEKVIYTEYGEIDYNRAYPASVYIYYQSGKCQYEDRQLVYERYYDYSNNKYTFVFDEDGYPELIIVESYVDNMVLYTFVEEISSDVQRDVFVLPNYEKVDVQDFYQ